MLGNVEKKPVSTFCNCFWKFLRRPLACIIALQQCLSRLSLIMENAITLCPFIKTTIKYILIVFSIILSKCSCQNAMMSFSLSDRFNRKPLLVPVPQFKGRPRKRKQSKTKATNDAKKTRVEKENSIPESRNILQMSPKEELKPGRNQTYRIIAPPVDSNPDRNVIHVKIENKNDPGNSKGIKEEIEYSKVDELDNDFERSSMEAESASPDEDDDYKLAIFGDSKFFSDEMVADEEEMDVRRTRSVKREDSDEAPPSELVKNGKTGTILDEAFFREMKNGIIAGEGVDKEKMIKVMI